MLVTTSSSRMVARNYWQDPQIGRQLPGAGAGADPAHGFAAPRWRRCRCEPASPGINLMVRDVARVGKGTMPGEYDRTSMQRYLSITANVEGEDLGRASRQVQAGLARRGRAAARRLVEHAARSRR